MWISCVPFTSFLHDLMSSLDIRSVGVSVLVCPAWYPGCKWVSVQWSLGTVNNHHRLPFQDDVFPQGQQSYTMDPHRKVGSHRHLAAERDVVVKCAHLKTQSQPHVFLFPRCLWWTVRWAPLSVHRRARGPWPATPPESSSLITWCSKCPILPRRRRVSRLTLCSKRWGVGENYLKHWTVKSVLYFQDTLY